VLIQIVTQVSPFFDVPAWLVRALIVLLAAGFPFVVVFAWVFELTPEGVKRTEDVPHERSIRRITGRKIDFAIIAALLLALAALLVDRTWSSRALTDRPVKSIAVLPFANLSEARENAFFADGIQDDILTSLAKIADLKVISRTSVMGYRGAATRNLREIGDQLRVAHILEGSVRRDGNRVKLAVQLIDARDDHHVWAQSYDRTISDSLTLQAELATEIARALEAKLSPEEQANVTRRQTSSADAYVLYLRARERELHPDTRLEDFHVAVQLYEEAIKLDPGFALAHAHLGATAARIHHFYEPSDAWKTRAHAEANEALRLEPNLGEGRFALGLCFYWLEGDYPSALRELTAAQRLLPNDSDVGLIVAAIARREGRLDEALAIFQRMAELDPQNPNVIRNLAYSFGAMRRWPEAIAAAERWRTLTPDSPNARMQGAYMSFFSNGSTEALEEFVRSVPPELDPDGSITAVRWDLHMIERDFAGAEAVLAASPVTELSYFNGGQTPKSFFAGCATLARGDREKALLAFAAARPEFQRAVQETPLSAVRHANLGLLCAFMGDKEAAIAEGSRAVELKPESVDAVDGPAMNCYLALIFAQVGEHERALALLERLVHTPHASDSALYSVTVSDLQKRWTWDPLRGDARFQRLIGGE
jgi:TolB-like protein/Flp pilus assembly protein TadD